MRLLLAREGGVSNHYTSHCWGFSLLELLCRTMSDLSSLHNLLLWLSLTQIL
jgi:hypothetical protein